MLLIAVFITLSVLLFANVSKYVPYTTLTIPQEKCSTKPEDPDRYGTLYAILKITAYNPVPEQTDDTPFEAAWGDPVRAGIIAISRDLEEFGFTRGTPVKIHGLEHMDTAVMDRTHRRKKKQLDILMFSEKAANRFGRQYRLVEIPINRETVQRIFEKYPMRLDCYGVE
jgi:3D (Asp-Asp-Asp) domain-containing protein